MLKTYKAYSMSQALAAVKRDLGADAVILNTRSARHSRWLGLLRRTVFEITAARAADMRRSGPRSKTGRAESRTSAEATRPARSGPDQYQRRAERLAQLMAETHSREHAAEGPVAPQLQSRSAQRSLPIAGKAPTPSPSAHAALSVSASAGSTTRAPAKPQHTDGVGAPRRFTLKQQQPTRAALLPAPTTLVRPTKAVDSFSPGKSVAVAQAADQTANQMQEELSAIKDMVGQVLQQQQAGGKPVSPTMPPKLFDMYLKLISQDLSEDLADDIVQAVREELSEDELEDEAIVQQCVRRHLGRFIPTADCAIDEVSADGRPLTIALIGPTGAGKTTTLAKLAASFKLRQNRRVGLITADTYRIAAVDQLRTYANIIGVPIKVALTPADMREALHELSACDVVLVDTAGRGQNDTQRLEELQRMIDAADPHEVHLVLSSTASEKVLVREAEAFSQIGADKIVLTKLDEAVSFGLLVNVMRQVGKELSFVTTGQEVPDHIEVGRADRLADLILGAEL